MKKARLVVLARQGPRLAAALTDALVPFTFKLDRAGQVAFEYDPRYEQHVLGAIRDSQRDDIPVILSGILNKVRTLANRVPGLNRTKNGTVQEIADYYVDGALEQLRESAETFDKTTRIAAELKKDIDWCRTMWRLDRESLLENSGYWKRQTEKMVEAGPGSVDQSNPHWASYRRLSERELHAKAKQAILDDLTKKIDKGQVTFEAGKE
jgi:hypothetical protein